MANSATLRLIEAIMDVREWPDAAMPALQSAVNEYVDGAKVRSAPPERVVANVKDIVTELTTWATSPDERSEGADLVALVAQWSIDRYFNA